MKVYEVRKFFVKKFSEKRRSPRRPGRFKKGHKLLFLYKSVKKSIFLSNFEKNEVVI